MKFGQWLGFCCFLVSLYILWQIRQLLLLLFTAIVIATALNRIVRKLGKFGIQRRLAIAITLIATTLIGSIFFRLIVPPFVEQFQQLIQLIPAGFNRVNAIVNNLELQRLDWLPALPDWAELITQLQLTDLFQNFLTLFSNSLGIFLQLLLVLTLTMMLLSNPQKYRQAFLLLCPSFYRRRADEILSKCEISLGNWLTGITINCLFVGTCSAVGLLILQVKLVLAHALIASLLNFIPNIGPVTSVIFPVTIALLDSPWKILPIVILYLIIQNLESYWLSPMIMAKQVSLLPAITLTAQIFCATTLGVLGLLLALPLTVVSKIWVEELLFIDILDKWNN